MDDKEGNAYGQWFENERIDITGRTYIDCMFVNCTLRFDGSERLLYNCTIHACYLVGDGWSPTWIEAASKPCEGILNG